MALPIYRHADGGHYVIVDDTDHTQKMDDGRWEPAVLYRGVERGPWRPLAVSRPANAQHDQGTMGRALRGDRRNNSEDSMKTAIVHSGEESHILYIARVSSNQENTDPGLISFLIRQNHWSPFEMIGACVEIETTRDIGRQILRHRSFSFQEFSQRYAAVPELIGDREMRLKGSSNRQGSLDERSGHFEEQAKRLGTLAGKLYHDMIEAGVAPESARSVLPEGLTPTRMYMNGTLRSWIHYLRERCKLDPNGKPYAQREHYRLAREIEMQLRSVFPVVFAALDDMRYIDAALTGEE